MTFLAPAYFYASLAVAAVVAALHFIVTRRPRATAFPTTRFIPDVPVEARARTIEPSDLLLLLVRVATVLAIGAALAGPILTPQRERTARVIVADESGSVASVSEVRDSVRSLFRPGDVIVAFDTAARVATRPDSVSNDVRRAPGLLSVALIAALRAGSRVRAGADSIELVLVSPLAGTESDRATDSIRAVWPGRARVVRVAAATGIAAVAPVIDWNAVVRPRFAVARARNDTASAVVAGSEVVVAPFERRWTFSADSLRGATVVARWIDGEPAAIERGDAASCTRSVAVPVDSTGDLPLRPELVRFATALRRPCGAFQQAGDGRTPAGDMEHPGRLASASMFPTERGIVSWLAPWLIASALVFMMAELALRRLARRPGVER